MKLTSSLYASLPISSSYDVDDTSNGVSNKKGEEPPSMISSRGQQDKYEDEFESVEYINNTSRNEIATINKTTPTKFYSLSEFPPESFNSPLRTIKAPRSPPSPPPPRRPAKRRIHLLTRGDDRETDDIFELSNPAFFVPELNDDIIINDNYVHHREEESSPSSLRLESPSHVQDLFADVDDRRRIGGMNSLNPAAALTRRPYYILPIRKNSNNYDDIW
mmetsp:Transcript_25263/g.31128  ORF Transcript_25263/g.31128 Transcript_25263/m.31128 type:complete len:219 (+) Transcript_25263:186-842(+)